VGAEVYEGLCTFQKKKLSRKYHEIMSFHPAARTSSNIAIKSPVEKSPKRGIGCPPGTDLPGGGRGTLSRLLKIISKDG
jgi:hypothetical protein